MYMIIWNQLLQIFTYLDITIVLLKELTAKGISPAVDLKYLT